MTGHVSWIHVVKSSSPQGEHAILNVTGTTTCLVRDVSNLHIGAVHIVIPRHRVVHRSLMAFSNKTLLDTTPEHAADSATSVKRAKAVDPARPDDSWLSENNRHAPMPVWLQLSRVSESFPSAVAPRSRAAASDSGGG